MSKIQLVVFDMAGTTISDKGDVADAFIKSFSDEGLTIPEASVRKVMGFRKADAIRLMLDEHYPANGQSAKHPPLTATSDRNALIDRIHTRFVGNMVAFYQHDPYLAPLPHAEEVFSRLKEQGLKVALNTGFTRSITDAILQRLRWDNAYSGIDRVICSDEVPEGRPAADMINALIRELHIGSAADVLKIGDTEADIEEGRNAGCGLVVSVTTGSYTRAQLEQYGPDYIIDDLAELLPIIERTDR